MKNILYIFLIIILFISCKKNRTNFLSQDQKDIINAFTEGDKFTMLKNVTDTLVFEITEVSLSTASNGYWYENGGPHTWTEKGTVTFKTINRELWEDGSIKVSGEAINSISLNINGVHTSKFAKKGTIEINNKIYNNVIIGTFNYSQTIDSSYFSVNDGIIKVWNNEVTYTKFN